MSASERAAALREQAKRLDTIAGLEDAAAAAKSAYQVAPDDPKAKAEHRAASQALAEARESLRAAQVQRTTDEGGTAVQPQAASGSGA